MKREKYFIALVRCFVLLLFVAIPLTAQSKKDKEQAKKFQDDADKAVAAKNYREAADLYGKSVLLVPNNSLAHYRKGFAHFSLKENDLAINELTLALTQGYKPLDIYRIRYFIYFDQGNYDAALADAQKGLGLAPNDTSFLNAVGEIYYARKSYPQALEAFQKVAKVTPTNGDVFYNIARVALAMNDAKAQADAASISLAKGSRFPAETFFLLGDAEHKLKNSTKAIDAYQRALALKPTMYQLYQNLADLYKSESKFTEAIDILKKGLIQFVNDGYFYTELGLVYSLAGRFKEAVDAARSGTQILPNQPEGYTNLCRAYNETKDFALAIIACNTSLRIRPDDGETYFYLGNALVNTNKSVEATRAYSSAVRGLVEVTKKFPDQSDNWYLLGNSYFADKQIDKAIEAYLKCLQISPKFLKARGNLGIAYTRMKNKAAATEQYNLLVAADAGLAARLKAEIDKM